MQHVMIPPHDLFGDAHLLGDGRVVGRQAETAIGRLGDVEGVAGGDTALAEQILGRSSADRSQVQGAHGERFIEMHIEIIR